jgi:hypothetical protein
MKYKILFLLLFCLTIGATSATFVYLKVSSSSKLKVTVSFSKDTYNLGESINPLFELKNEGTEPVVIWDKFGVETGFLRVIATKDKDSANIIFGNSKWGTKDFIGKTVLSSNEVKQSTSGILWYNDKNGKPQFKLSEAGIYYFKIRYKVFLEEGKPSFLEIESEPVKITITEPQGEDLEVWNKIKDNGNFAYFIQEGDMLIPTYKPEERAKFQAEVEDILQKYPNSFYAQSLRQSLDKFKLSEAKRQEFIEKMKSQQKQKP